ncbi:Coenzyme A disulfide reductase [Planctopirus ephydatiae]|uniref:Coenzyme A disulfide reductase n=2 Tax=Planctopirus ephydatiae TaxID=2528019 RepID=A0A518GNU6_9PLAN|nr:Coenzyme A disulfide reductase [Planctopirus ephydatiae]
MKVIIVGGVAGGASCAARLRRLDETAEILMVERGPYVSYANCGLPYHVGGKIEKESSLMVATEDTFRGQFAIDVRTRCEVVNVSSELKTVELKNHVTGEVTTEKYDKLVLSPGAAPIRPPLPGINLPGIFSVRTVPDARNMREWLDRGAADSSGMNSYTGYQTLMKPKRAVVVGGGFIGLEMVENLVHRGLEVTLIEKLNQVMPPLDPEMAILVERYMTKHGVRLELNDGVAEFRQTADGSLEVLTSSGKAHPADIVILAIGVRPETNLAKMAGIEIGQRGGIRVDEHMRTSNPDIFAVGDAVEVKEFVTGEWSLVALAGPANRQGRIAADVIAGRNSRFRGTQGTSICQIFEAAIAQTGVSEKTLNQIGDTDFEKIYLYPNSHAGYYPGAKMLAIKVIFRKSNGRLLGAQVLGEDGVPKRIDSFAMAIQMGCTVYDLEESELCYAPPFGSAKDPVNFAGMVAADILRGDMPQSHWNVIGNEFLLDVRNPSELAVETVPGAINIPLPELRSRLGELPRNREIFVICRSGQRAYYATRILLQKGFQVRNLAGGMLSRSHAASSH